MLVGAGSLVVEPLDEDDVGSEVPGVVEVVVGVVGSGSGAGGAGGTGIAPSNTIGTRSAIKRLRPTIDLFPIKADSAQAFAAIATSMRVSMLGVFGSIVSGVMVMLLGTIPTRFK